MNSSEKEELEEHERADFAVNLNDKRAIFLFIHHLMTDNLDQEFDYIIIGSGLTQAMAAASLALSGASCVLVEPNSYFGEIATDIMLRNIDVAPYVFTKKFIAPDLPPLVSRFTVELSCSHILSSSAVIDLITQAKLSAYAPMEQLTLPLLRSSTGTLFHIPLSKANLLTSKALTITEKRRILRFTTATIDWLSAVHPDWIRPVKPDRAVAGDILSTDAQIVDESVKAEETCLELAQRFCLPEYLLRALWWTPDISGSAEAFIRSLASIYAGLDRFSPGQTAVFPTYGTGDFVQALMRVHAVSGGIAMLGSEAVVHPSEDGMFSLEIMQSSLLHKIRSRKALFSFTADNKFTRRALTIFKTKDDCATLKTNLKAILVASGSDSEVFNVPLILSTCLCVIRLGTGMILPKNCFACEFYNFTGESDYLEELTADLDLAEATTLCHLEFEPDTKVIFSKAKNIFAEAKRTAPGAVVEIPRPPSFRCARSHMNAEMAAACVCLHDISSEAFPTNPTWPTSSSILARVNDCKSYLGRADVSEGKALNEEV